MSAFRRRTLFAAPLILSVAACGKSEPESTHNPPVPVTKNPPGPAFRDQWDVRRVDAGKCEANELFTCEPQTKCNPPPPRAVECPPGTSGKTVIRIAELHDQTCAIVPKGCVEPSCAKLKTVCPLPAGQKLPDKLVEVWVVEKNKQDDGCHAEEPPVDCPPNTDCNPPSPMKIECPPGVTDRVTVKVGLLADKTCAILPEGCDKPACATPKVACPKS
jgi:hypothetical protein